ncbi:MAG: cob(I)yrinic acid a,c-diamide adenosyltransferase [Candidatus Heimdallarchaeota archaeon]|nr:cob(I)yrinic acid a,c-diamide adenosyltransferase [Candidatus Heimdallarchaeota archaeon]
MVKITFIVGEGKGKTTTSIGYIFQKQREGKSILVAQFLKTGKNCGECNFFKDEDDIRWFTFGKDGFYQSKDQKDEYVALINNGINVLERELKIAQAEILLLDEAGIALSFGLISWNQLKDIFPYVSDEIILTGRKFPEGLKSEADTIIEVKEIKHPYTKNIEARRGIEF